MILSIRKYVGSDFLESYLSNLLHFEGFFIYERVAEESYLSITVFTPKRFFIHWLKRRKLEKLITFYLDEGWYRDSNISDFMTRFWNCC